jgi:hypothetical protein
MKCHRRMGWFVVEALSIHTVEEDTMTISRTLPAVITVELPEAFDPNWSRLPGISVDGRTVSINSAEYFFRFESSTWLVCDWSLVEAQLLPISETAEIALEQITLEFIRAHAEITNDAARVLTVAWHVYNYLFREEHLDGIGLEVMSDHLRMLRQAAVLMALNKVEESGHISNVGPCWFFPSATGVVFDLDESDGHMLDEVYHGTWFNEHRRLESVKAHAALGGRLVHGCQSAPNQSGGALVPYGASLGQFKAELSAFRAEWIAAVEAQRVTD